MLKINNAVFPSTGQWLAVIRGMRHPLLSYAKSDSEEYVTNPDDIEFGLEPNYDLWLGDNDKDLMTRLIKSGTEHRKFMRQLPVIVDVTAPLYYWKEADQYRVSSITNSTSTMHKITAKEFALDDFSHEHLDMLSLQHLSNTIEYLNKCRENYLGEYAEINGKKECWWQLIQLLPSSYNQTRTWSLNYEVLYNIYYQRRNHKLDEWHTFCDWIENEVPHMYEFLGEPL